MFKSLYSLFIFLFLLNNFSYSNGPGVGGESGNSSEWELIEQEEGIEVYERWVNLDDDLKVRERTGKMVLKCSISQVANLVADNHKTHLWMSNVEQAQLLKKPNPQEWYVHTVIDAPWPFNKQDMVSRYERHDFNDKTIITISHANGLVPLKEDVTRLDSFNAEWQIEQLSPGKVRVTFTTKSTKPPEYPCWMQDPVVRKVFFSNLRNFKSLVHQDKG